MYMFIPMANILMLLSWADLAASLVKLGILDLESVIIIPMR